MPNVAPPKPTPSRENPSEHSTGDPYVFVFGPSTEKESSPIDARQARRHPCHTQPHNAKRRLRCASKPTSKRASHDLNESANS